jgi:hypothetical protein
VAELDKHISEAVRVEVWQAYPRKRFTKDCTYRCSAAPVLSLRAASFKLARGSKTNVRSGEERVVTSPKLFLTEISIIADELRASSAQSKKLKKNLGTCLCNVAHLVSGPRSQFDTLSI